MKSNFNSALFGKKIDLKTQSLIIGGDFSDSGGSETSQSDGGSDTNTVIYDDNCQESCWIFTCTE